MTCGGLRVPKVSQFGITFDVIFGYFGGYGEIVKIALSRERELDPEGWMGIRNEIHFGIFQDMP